MTMEEYNILSSLPSHPDISNHLSDCFPESRVDDEARILQWIDSGHPSELVLCILGKVGVGKSTLAKGLAIRLAADKHLAASVFLGFARPDWTAEAVIKMAAMQLGSTYAMLTRSINKAICLDVNPLLSLETRIQRLILEPIRSLRLPHALVILLDALDQWVPHAAFIKALASLTTDTNIIKFVVFGRPGLEDRFQNVPVKKYDLPNVVESVMAKYFTKRFRDVRWEHGQPSVHTIDQLVKRARGLFIWSSTLCSLLQDELSCPNPNEAITSVLQSQQRIDDNDILAKLYHDTIHAHFLKRDHKEKLTVFLQAVLVLQEPLPITAFAPLVSMGERTVVTILKYIRPLQTGQMKDDQDMIYPASFMFHLSFLEYLQNAETPSHLAFPIDAFTSHSQLGKACLEELHRLPSAPASAEVFTEASTSITPLQKYVMRYWPTHTAHGTPTVSPTSNVEWKATPHSAILEGLPASQWHYWSTWYLQALRPGAVLLLTVTPKSVLDKWFLAACATFMDLVQKLCLDPADGASDFPTYHIPQLYTACVLRALAKASQHFPTLMADAIHLAEVAVRLQHREASIWLILGSAYENAAQRESDAPNSVVENAVRACRCAAELKGNRSFIFHQVLGNSLHTRFNRLGQKEDLDEAISARRAAVLLVPLGHPAHSTALSNLATSLQAHFTLTGTTLSLDEALTLQREVLLLRPLGHPYRAKVLTSLAASLQSQFELTGHTDCVNEAIILLREALQLWPPGHPERGLALNNLAYSLQSQLDHAGTTLSLDEAITLHREALLLRPSGHSYRALSLNNLSLTLQTHHRLTGTSDSLDDSIVLLREAVSLSPSNHPHREPRLTSLADSLQTQFEVTGNVENLNEAITLLREALSLLPPGHQRRDKVLEDLFHSLLSHFILSKDSADRLGELIVLWREGLSLRPPGHPRRAVPLLCLGRYLHIYFKLTGASDSLDESIVL